MSATATIPVAGTLISLLLTAEWRQMGIMVEPAVMVMVDMEATMTAGLFWEGTMETAGLVTAGAVMVVMVVMVVMGEWH
jgi:hypothetical protein